MAPKARKQVQEEDKIVCHCVKRCGGPGGIGKSLVYSSVMRHRREDVAAMSSEFTQFLGSAGSSATSSRSSGATLPPTRSQSPAAITSRGSDRRTKGRKGRKERNLTEVDVNADEEEDGNEGSHDRQADSLDRTDGPVDNMVCTFNLFLLIFLSAVITDY